MHKQEIARILSSHKNWMEGSLSGELASITGTRLVNADLSGINLRWIDLSTSDLNDADFSNADLHGANLSKTHLSRTNFTGANLSLTCIDPDLHQYQRTFCRECPPVNRHGGRIVYRTAKSRYEGNTEYNPGHTYIAPILSFDCVSVCHPGIYAASLRWIKRQPRQRGTHFVRCYVRDGDWVITGKGAIRCKKLRVLNRVEI